MKDLAHIPDTARVALGDAHLLIGKGKSTVYRWWADGVLPATDTGKGYEVTMGDLRAAETKMRRGRPRKGAKPNA